MNSSPSFRRIASNYLFTGRHLVKHPLVTVRADGRIESVETCAAPDGRPGVEFYAGVLVPGLINVHCHLELSYLRGAIAQDGGFAAFARSMGRVRGQFSEQERAAAIAAADARMWAEGMQAVGDVANGDSAFAVKARSRLSYRTFAEVFGLHTDSTDEQRRLLRYPETSLTPHSIYSVQDALFREICAEGDEPLSIHFMETPAEAELFEQRGELWEWYRKAGFTCDFLHYGSPARRIVESVPGRPERYSDSQLLRESARYRFDNESFHGSGLVVPVSRLESLHFAAGSPVELLRRNGLNICLGTDSLASNTALSLLGEMQHLGKIPLAELLTWAAPNGARALGFSELGEVAAGKRPGLAVLSGLDYDSMTLTPASCIARIL